MMLNKNKKKPRVFGTADISRIAVVKTRVVNVLATKLSPDVKAKALQAYLSEKLNKEIKCREIDTQWVTVEHEIPESVYDPKYGLPGPLCASTMKQGSHMYL